MCVFLVKITVAERLCGARSLRLAAQRRHCGCRMEKQSDNPPVGTYGPIGNNRQTSLHSASCDFRRPTRNSSRLPGMMHQPTWRTEDLKPKTFRPGPEPRLGQSNTLQGCEHIVGDES